ncbi:MAG: HNH endonuclease [Chloroflexi bacterium]|nr:HNH endonuclease [Chloroflexota bacterium]MYC02277.1 HNH endonuclease [Chloroflexota bacterium]
MAISIVVAVTDRDWLTFLSSQSDLTEVNFWSPSPMQFRSLQEGELLLFKAKSPVNKIVGGGIFAHSTVMPCSYAWEAFGTNNGAGSLLEMRARIARLRSTSPNPFEDFDIGCRILTQPFFFDEAQWFDPPPSWSQNIVRHKTYSSDTDEGYELWNAVQDKMRIQHSESVAQDAPAYGAPQLVAPRLGQGAFRLKVTDIYARKCAVTGEKTLPALEAAHIRPYSDGGRHDASNGLLLRRDIHRLFDTGYVTVNPSLRLEVSRSIREQFSNGRHYYAMHGSRIYVPHRTDERPDLAALEWHNENVYKG